MMNNKTKTLLVALPLVFWAMTSAAQGAYSDLLHALHYSQAAANAGSAESAANYASQAFNGAGSNSYYDPSYKSGPSFAPARSERSRARSTMDGGLKITYSGYNRGAEMARRNAEMRAIRAERARQEAERRERILAAYLAPRLESSRKQEEALQIFIANNSQAKIFNPEDKAQLMSNGLSGNVVIEDDGQLNMMPEMLLQGTVASKESLEDRIKTMSSEEIDKLAEELNRKYENGEELSDEELDFLIAYEERKIAELEAQLEKKRLEEEANRRINEKLDNVFNPKQ